MLRLFVLFFFLSFSLEMLHAQEVLKQEIEITSDSLQLQSLLSEIEKQADISFAFNKRRIPLKKRVGGNYTNSLESVLDAVLADEGISYSISGNQIILYREIIPSYTISGYIRDTASGEALIGANIFETAQYRGTSANNFGFYSLTLPEGRHEVAASFVGYSPFLDTLALFRDTTIEILLGADAQLLEVVVTDTIMSITNPTNNERQDGSVKVDMTEVNANPSLLGERDVLKRMQLLPGVAFGTEGTSGMHVHGGSADQNLILLDGVQLYNVDHLFGFVSIFNGKAINTAYLYKSGFPARYSGRLSSVLDVRMKDGNNKELHGGISMGLLSGNAYLEGPIAKGKSSFIISGRRTWLDIIAASLQVGELEFKANYGFHDINAKVNIKLNNKDRLFLSAYSGKDRFFYEQNPGAYSILDSVATANESRLELAWGNQAYAIRWNRIVSPKVFMNTTATVGIFNFSYSEIVKANPEENNSTETDILARSKIQDIGWRTTFDYIPNYKQHWRLGFGYTLHDFTPGFLRLIYKSNNEETFATEGAPEVNVHEAFVFAENEIKVDEKLTLHPGFHLTLINTGQKTFFAPQLRFRLKYQNSPYHYWHFSYSGMSQFIHRLTNTGIGPPTDLWMPSTELVPPEYSHQIAAGNHLILGEKWFMETGAYFKTMDNLVEYQAGATFTNSTSNWESRVDLGKGWSYGGELLLKKHRGRTKAWLAYSLSWSWRKFNNINNGKVFPYTFDRRHNLNININHSWNGKKRNKKKNISLTWVLTSGNMVTVPKEWYYSLDGELIHSYFERNNYRLPNYHRLDLSKTTTRPSKNGNTHTWAWGIFNVYGQANPINVRTLLPFEVELGLPPKLIGESILAAPIPYIQYQFDF